MLRNTYLREAKPNTGSSKDPHSAHLPPPLPNGVPRPCCFCTGHDRVGTPSHLKQSWAHSATIHEISYLLLCFTSVWLLDGKAMSHQRSHKSDWEVQGVERNGSMTYLNNCNELSQHTSEVQNHHFNFCPVK